MHIHANMQHHRENILLMKITRWSRKCNKTTRDVEYLFNHRYKT